MRQKFRGRNDLEGDKEEGKKEMGKGALLRVFKKKKKGSSRAFQERETFSLQSNRHKTHHFLFLEMTKSPAKLNDFIEARIEP
jgi:hypothetical protein